MYDLHMIDMIDECRVSVVGILLQPVRSFIRQIESKEQRKKDETRKSTPALPKASLSVAISAVSIPLLVLADVVIFVEY